MRRLARPTFTAREALALCVASIRDVSLKGRLQLISPALDAAETNYLALAYESALYRTLRSVDINGQVSSDEMERLYSQTFVRSVRTRHIYNAIKSTPENDICPLCGQRTVSTLDHYLPQSLHPNLTITSANLVPACAECNKIKLARQAAEAGEQTLHPYFDDFDDGQWLYAAVIEAIPAALVFSVRAPGHWDDIKRKRIAAHFRTFGLGSLYASHSAVELGNLRGRLKIMARRMSADQIKAYMHECEEGCSQVQKNSWQRATYQALALSDWFCSGGFDGAGPVPRGT